VLLVSGVFILLAAGMSLELLATLDLRAALFVLAVICIARPLPVLIALLGTNIPWRERLLVAFTGPRGVVLVAVAGLFGERLVALGVEDAGRIAPLAFALVAATVVLHGFTLTPVARALGLTAARAPGVLILGGSRWSVALGQALQKLELPVMIVDPNHAHLRGAREAGLPVFYGDILSEAAEHRIDHVAYETLICATDNDAYNTLVATDLAPEFGRDHVYQIKRVREASARHALPVTLGGKALAMDESFFEVNARITKGWELRVTALSDAFTVEDWRTKNPEAIALAEKTGGALRWLSPGQDPRGGADTRVLALVPPSD
jgi:hypothetical protein